VDVSIPRLSLYVVQTLRLHLFKCFDFRRIPIFPARLINETELTFEQDGGETIGEVPHGVVLQGNDFLVRLINEPVLVVKFNYGETFQEVSYKILLLKRRDYVHLVGG